MTLEKNRTIEREIAVLSDTGNHHTKELNIVSWSDHEPMYEIRSYSGSHDKPGRGIALSISEAQALSDALSSEFSPVPDVSSPEYVVVDDLDEANPAPLRNPPSPIYIAIGSVLAVSILLQFFIFFGSRSSLRRNYEAQIADYQALVSTLEASAESNATLIEEDSEKINNLTGIVSDLNAACAEYEDQISILTAEVDAVSESQYAAGLSDGKESVESVNDTQLEAARTDGYESGYDTGYDAGYTAASDEYAAAIDQYLSFSSSFNSSSISSPSSSGSDYTSSTGYSSSTTVYVSRAGKIHLSSTCSGMKYYTTMTLGKAESAGYDHCQKCF